MTPQFAEILHIAGYQMAMCSEPLGAFFMQIIREPTFELDRGCSRGYQAEWEIQDGRLYLIRLAGTLQSGRQVTVATFFPKTSDRVVANWYTGPLIEPDSSRSKYIPGSNCVYDCDLFINIEMGQVSDAYLSRAGGPKDHHAAVERYGTSALK